MEMNVIEALSLCQNQVRNKLLKSGGARNWIGMWIFKTLGEFVAFFFQKIGDSRVPLAPQIPTALREKDTKWRNELVIERGISFGEIAW